MSNDRDLLRALDRVEPLDQWDEILAVASQPATHTHTVFDSSRPSRRAVMVAAAVLLLAGVTALTLNSRYNPSVEVASGAPSTSVLEPIDNTDQIWGHIWDIESVSVDGRTLEVPDHGAFGTPSLDLQQEGQLRLAVCNGFGGPARMEEDRLVQAGSWGATLVGCIGPLGELNAAVAQLLMTGPTIELRGDHLMLTSDRDVSAFVKR